MAFYRKISNYLQAEIYSPGMEDGYLIETSLGTDSIPKDSYSPQLHKIISPLIGFTRVVPGDYIIKDNVTNVRKVIPKEQFEQTYIFVCK